MTQQEGRLFWNLMLINRDVLYQKSYVKVFQVGYKNIHV